MMALSFLHLSSLVQRPGGDVFFCFFISYLFAESVYAPYDAQPKPTVYSSRLNTSNAYTWPQDIKKRQDQQQRRVLSLQTPFGTWQRLAAGIKREIWPQKNSRMRIAWAISRPSSLMRHTDLKKYHLHASFDSFPAFQPALRSRNSQTSPSFESWSTETKSACPQVFHCNGPGLADCCVRGGRRVWLP